MSVITCFYFNFTYYYQYLQLSAYVYLPVENCYMCYGSVVRGFGSNAYQQYLLALVQDLGRVCWGIPQQFDGLSPQGNSPKLRIISRQACLLNGIWLLAFITLCVIMM